MKNGENKKPSLDQDEMLPEYTLRASKGVRGKYYRSMRKGYTITIHRKDGTPVVKEVKPKGFILLEADVQKHFPNSESVNAALRSLITSAPLKRTTKIRETPSAYRVRRAAKRPSR